MTESNIKVPELPEPWGPTITVGTTRIDFGPLILYGCLVLAMLLCMLIFRFFHIWQAKKLNKYLIEGDYSKVPKVGESLLKQWIKYVKRYKNNKRWPIFVAQVDYFNLCLAIAYFALSEEEKFLSRINSVNQNLDLKEFWLSLYFLQKEDFEQFKFHSEKISDSDQVKVNRTYLEAYYAFKQGQTELAKELMTSIFDSLKNPCLRDLAKTVMNKN